MFISKLREVGARAAIEYNLTTKLQSMKLVPDVQTL